MKIHTIWYTVIYIIAKLKFLKLQSYISLRPVLELFSIIFHDPIRSQKLVKGVHPWPKIYRRIRKNWLRYFIFWIKCPKVLFCSKIIDIWAKNGWISILAITFVFCFKSYAIHIKITPNYSMVGPQWIFKYFPYKLIKKAS